MEILEHYITDLYVINKLHSSLNFIFINNVINKTVSPKYNGIWYFIF